MNDLATWLRAQLDDDERMARMLQEKRPGPWSTQADYQGEPAGGTAVVTADGELVLVGRGGVPADYAAEWHPARVLAEVDAKRRILDWAIEYMEGDYAPWNETCVQLLALPYADRPGYRAEWRP